MIQVTHLKIWHGLFCNGNEAISIYKGKLRHAPIQIPHHIKFQSCARAQSPECKANNSIHSLKFHSIICSSNVIFSHIQGSSPEYVNSWTQISHSAKNIQTPEWGGYIRVFGPFSMTGPDLDKLSKVDLLWEDTRKGGGFLVNVLQGEKQYLEASLDTKSAASRLMSLVIGVERICLGPAI